MAAPAGGGGPAEGAPAAVAEVRWPGPGPLRLLEWKVAAGAAVRIGSVLAVGLPATGPGAAAPAPPSLRADRGATRRVRSERAGVVRELCAQPGQVVVPGAVLVRLEGCSHPVVMKGLCAECGQDLTQMLSKNGTPRGPLSTATVSMVHSVPELMVSSEQAEKLGREDQQRLHRNRKLVLMVDLDQTLIHTTEQHCPQMSNKGIFHFQLGRGEPMLHTRLRPHCKEFLERVAQLYELHVFTFGSRLYAHTIAGFLDPEKKLFSHRILSRDECIDPFSKTGNLRNLFPCGDSMVCIIDDREDVWKFAPNLITVKKYVYFQGTGDINAPPGAREPQARKRANHSCKGVDVSEHTQPLEDAEESKPAPGIVQGDGLGRASRVLNGGQVAASDSCRGDTHAHEKGDGRGSSAAVLGPSAGPARSGTLASLDEARGAVGKEARTLSERPADLDFDLSSDSESSGGPDGQKPSSPSASESESEERAGRRRPVGTQDGAEALPPGVAPDAPGGRPGGARRPGETGCGARPQDGQEEGEEGLCGLGDGCVERKEAETESQNSEQSGITAGESLDQSLEEEEAEEDPDHDDHLIHLEDILVRVHGAYYARYDRLLGQGAAEVPDIRRIVPELKSKVLAGAALVFSGLHPTSLPVEKTREHYHATALGARVLTELVLSPDAPDRTTHLVAARAGTEKVRQAQEWAHVHVVNPDWLWSCLERWDRVEEQLYPLKDDDPGAQRVSSPAAPPARPGAFPPAIFHPMPVHPKSPPGPEVRIYDSHTGKLIRKSAPSSGPPPYVQAAAAPVSTPARGALSSFRIVEPHQGQMFDEELPDHRDGEQPGPSRRKRQPSMSETLPLYTLCKEDLDSMDREVDDILGEGSDDSDSERKKPEDEEEAGDRERPALGATTARRPGPAGASGERSQAGSSTPRGHKRKLDEEDASESSRESSNEDGEGSSSEADEMAAALEAELSDLM
ncbi:RNA polymerase II subunit A C-terminal domain phosphatase isoform X1 [Dasypus novemcinctus]|uniref:RNA polymerase II subunit A C-terminal domain phosphatase isoform X1 n=1 Tax=Dasypus novemcinctus TaxID=9361 RepID=UPI000328DD8E|nr:RNA polymerase II subunit A C-terminal domain phosphatase isoform X1 [Dasypus novemcinctus]